jgi:hypothetical protein
MTGSEALDRFLQTDPADVGCGEAMAMLHIFAELVAAGADDKLQHAGIAAHLRACGPCGEDFDGLLAAITNEDRSARDRLLERSLDCPAVRPAGVGEVEFPLFD